MDKQKPLHNKENTYKVILANYKASDKPVWNIEFIYTIKVWVKPIF